MAASTSPHASPFQPTALSNKIAIVTGGGSGICYGITQQLLLHGCEVAIIVGRREGFLQKAASNLSSLSGKMCDYRVCDVRDATACQVCISSDDLLMRKSIGRRDFLI